MAAAALLFDVHSDLPAAFAAKATEYMLEPAAASVAAFLLDGQTDWLSVLAARAFHYIECQSDKRFRQLQRQPRFWWGVLLLPLFFTCPSGAGLHLSARKRNKDAHQRGAKDLVISLTSIL